MKLPVIIATAVGAAVLSLTLVTAPAIAGDPCGYDSMNPCAKKMMMNPCEKKERMAKHHAMKKEHMGMLREVMVILKDLNHKPTKAQKKTLSKYIDKIDKRLAESKMWDKKHMNGKGHHDKGMGM